MKRRLLNLLTALSLLLCVAVCALWVRSRRIVECGAITSSRGWSGAVWSSVTGFEICGTSGLRSVEPGWAYTSRLRTSGPVVRRSAGTVVVEHSHLGRPVPRTGFAGFGWTIDPKSPVADPRFGTYPASYWSFVLPFWFLAVMTAAPVLWQIVRFVLRRARHGAGLCPVCGYDLRASPGRCPECGHAGYATPAI